MKYDDLAMTDKELVELGEATLHGTPPFKTILRMYHGAMRLMGERCVYLNAAAIRTPFGLVFERHHSGDERVEVMVLPPDTMVELPLY